MERGLQPQVFFFPNDELSVNIHAGANSAMKMFQKRDELGTSDMSTKLNTTHQNQVSEVGLSAQLFKVETKLKIQFLGATLLWRQGVGRNYFHCRWRRKTRPLGYRSSQAEGSQDLERVQSLNFKPGGFDTFRQLS